MPTEKTIENATRALPILVSYARKRASITYKELAEKIGCHWRATPHLLGYIRDEICRGKPLLTAIVVNGQTGLPGDDFLPGGTKHLTRVQYQEKYEEIRDRVFAYSGWEDLLANLGLSPLPPEGKTYLLTWNPTKWTWKDFHDDLQKLRAGRRLSVRWSCGNNQSIKPSDRLFLIRLGVPPRGIFASGWATSNVFTAEHWNPQYAKQRKSAHYIDMELDNLLDAENEQIYDLQELARFFGQMRWDNPASGTIISQQLASRLEKKWLKFIHDTNEETGGITEEEILTQTVYEEGTTRKIFLDVYERNTQARLKCIEHYGHNCSICGFSFEERFGRIGKGFIHVHHLAPVSEKKRPYCLDPIKDLRTVCANCHAIIHRRKKTYSIDRLAALLKKNK